MIPAAVLIIAARTGLLGQLPAAQVRNWLTLAAPSPTQLPKNNAPNSPGPRQLLVDVSVIHEYDAGTGIQRVTRSVLHNLRVNPPPGFIVCCVATTHKSPYCYVDATGKITTEQVAVDAGDVFLGLDLAAHLIPHKLGQLTRWKLSGATLHFVVYDMLPLTHSAQFKPARTRHFRAWANTIIRLADSLLCISNSVQADLENWLLHNAGLTSLQLPMHIITLGGDFDAVHRSERPKLSADVLHILTKLLDQRWVLLVGTIEPRKCHGKVLDAFEILWKCNSAVSLVLVGRSGWHTELLQQRIKQHPELNKRLYWINDANDSDLEEFYRNASGVVLASLAEGYGLPLNEAIYYGKPLLVRDIPVFREVAGQAASYFVDDDPLIFSATLQAWISDITLPTSPQKIVPVTTWEDSTKGIVRAIGIAAHNCPDIPHGVLK